MPEISDADSELLKLAKKALGDPKTRMTQLRILKTAEPSTPIPELDQEDRIQSALAPIVEENKKLRADIDKRDTLDGIKEKRNVLKGDKFKLNDEQISAVEKIMVEKKIGDHETAAEFFLANSRVATPSVAPRSWDTSATVPVTDGLKKDPAQWARQTAAAVIDELRGIKR